MCKESTVQIVHFGKDWDRVAAQAIVGLFAYCEEMIASPKQSHNTSWDILDSSLFQGKLYKQINSRVEASGHVSLTHTM